MAVVAFPRVAGFTANVRPRGAAVYAKPLLDVGAFLSGLFVAYPFNELGPAAGFRDAGRSNQHLVAAAQNCVFWDPDFGGCLNFANNGVTSPLTSPANGFLGATLDDTDATDLFTLAFWFKTSTDQQDIWSIQGTGTGLSIIIVSVGLNAGGGTAHRLNVFWRNEGSITASCVSVSTVDDGQWHEAWLGITTGGPSLWLAVDGVSATNGGGSGGSNQAFGVAPVRIGGYSHAYTGKLAQMRWGAMSSIAVGNDVRPSKAEQQSRGADFFWRRPTFHLGSPSAVGPPPLSTAWPTVVAG
jgi:hypothetical protein